MNPLAIRLTDLRSRLWLAVLKRRLRRVAQIDRLRRIENEEVRRLAPSTRALPDSRVAVIVPTHGRDRLVGEAVDSVLNQTEDDLVVLVVADGPPGPTSLPVDERLAVVTLTENIGVVGVVRNIGIRLTRAPLIAFLDDDNTWMPEHLATLLPAIDAGADLAYSAVDRVLPDGRRFDQLFEPFDRDGLRNRNYIDMSSLVVSRDQGVRFSRLPIRPGEAPSEDWELVWRLSRSRRVSGVPTPTVRYLINPDSYFWQGFTDHAEQIVTERSTNPDGAEQG